MSPEQSSGNLFGAPPRDPGSHSEWITAFCDGGSRGNPGPAGYGVYIEGPDGEKLAELSEYLGKTTNNVAEYSGLLAAIDYALREGRSRLRVVSDSELMVKQIKGQYKVNSADLRPLYDEAKRRIARLEMFRIEHVLRGKNQRADRLANLAMDKGTGRDRSGEAQNGSAARPAGPEPPKTLKGFTKGGVIHLIEGELPDGVFVRIIPDRQ
ncbi:MAG TPA: ribonuclease HI family protein [Acidobacteriaceae bacterium]